MAQHSQIGVVTVTYNSSAVLSQFLKCAFKQAHRDFILFAVDNASSDDTLCILQECQDERLKIIANRENLGVAAGNNQGIRAALEAKCDSVLLINNDTEFDELLFSLLDEGANKHRMDMVSPKMMFYDEPDRIWSTGGMFHSWRGYQPIDFGGGQMDVGQHNLTRLITYAPTCCVLMKKEVFDVVGLMDERYFVYMDDVDFMYRAMNARIKLMYLPEAKLFHKVGRLTGGQESTFTIRYCTRNRIFFWLKHFGAVCSAPLIALYQLHILIDVLRGKYRRKDLCVKQAAVIEGMRMWRSRTSTTMKAKAE
jgi:GT2 family glycosyltransferase